MIYHPHIFGNPESELPIGPDDQVCVWEEPDTKVVYHFNATAMFIYWAENRDCGECAIIPVSKELYDHTKTMKGVERHRLTRITKKTLKIPTLWVEWEIDAKGEPWHVCIDGAHRIVWAYEHGITEIKAVIFKKPTWSKCLVKYDNKIIENFIPKFSGIF